MVPVAIRSRVSFATGWMSSLPGDCTGGRVMGSLRIALKCKSRGMSENGAVLITGCSTGIGRATAEYLAAKGHKVYASARRPESISDLEAKGIKTLALDVTDEASMRAAVTAVEQAEGHVGVLVNNAGYSQSGAVESVKLDDVRASSRPTSSA